MNMFQWIQLSNSADTEAANVPGGVLVRTLETHSGDGADGEAGTRIALAMAFVPGAQVSPGGFLEPYGLDKHPSIPQPPPGRRE